MSATLPIVRIPARRVLPLTEPVHGLHLAISGDRLCFRSAAGRTCRAVLLELDPYVVFDSLDLESGFPELGTARTRLQPTQRIDPVLIEPRTQEYLRGLRRSIQRAAAAKPVLLPELAGADGGDKRGRILGSQAAVHKAMGKPERTGREPMSAKVAGLPELDFLALKGTKKSSSVLATTTVATPVGADETDRTVVEDRRFAHLLEVELEESFEMVELDSSDSAIL